MNYNRVQEIPDVPGRRRLPPSQPLPPRSSRKGIPLWVVFFTVFSCSLAGMVVYRRNAALRVRTEAETKAIAQRKKAEELAAKGFEKLRMARRNQLYLLCVESGDLPMFFMDKVVCVKQEAIAWVKRDENPEVDTTE